MRDALWGCVLVLFLPAPATGFGGSGLTSGSLDSSTGVPEKGLGFEDFQITPDGFITGFIVKATGRVRPGVRLDMWTTNRKETRIL
jgi:hypothetical protein